MDTKRKPCVQSNEKYSTPAAAEWNRTGYDYSGLWRMYDSVVTELKRSIKINAAAN